MLDFFGRGAIAEYYVESNGVTYAISEWVKYETREPDGWVVAWAQNGQAFMASLPAAFTEEDVLDFCDAQAIVTCETGDGSVSCDDLAGRERMQLAAQDAEPSPVLLA